MMQSYPHSAGYKDNYASKEAAIAIDKSGKREYQRNIVQAMFQSVTRPMGADEAWELSGKEIDLHSFRSRTSELSGEGILNKLHDVRARSITGKSVSSYIWADYYRAPVQYTYDSSGQGVMFA